MNNWVMFESLEIKRGGYYVKYDPLVIGNAESKPFVSVRIIDDLTISECKEIVEMEYRYWLGVPMCVARNFTNFAGVGLFRVNWIKLCRQKLSLNGYIKG